VNSTAELRGCEFWTADERLFRRVGDRLTFVRWLEDYPAVAPGGGRVPNDERRSRSDPRPVGEPDTNQNSRSVESSPGGKPASISLLTTSSIRFLASSFTKGLSSSLTMVPPRRDCAY
jgi:hypothetical protein